MPFIIIKKERYPSKQFKSSENKDFKSTLNCQLKIILMCSVWLLCNFFKKTVISVSYLFGVQHHCECFQDFSLFLARHIFYLRRKINLDFSTMFTLVYLMYPCFQFLRYFNTHLFLSFLRTLSPPLKACNASGRPKPKNYLNCKCKRQNICV